jgi:thioredoxin-dependent peroxiredoxin
MIQIKVGDKAPEFKGINQNGDVISLQNYIGKKVVIYFYPRDNTPGCTAEACDLRDNYSMLQSRGYEVIGISADDSISHKKFIDKYSLPFNLIADTDKSIIRSYGAWGKKNNYGKEYEGIIRMTFIVSEKGNIEDIITKVDTKKHTSQFVK